MSIESTFKNRLDVNLTHTRPLQSTLSQRENTPSRRSLKSPSRQEHHRRKSQTRSRTISASEEPPTDTLTELTPVSTSPNKNDRRYSELKPPVERHDHTPVERRNSTPQLYFNALFPHGFRNQKHHHKINTKDETNTTNITPNNVNATISTSSNHFADTMTTKPDSPFLLKPSTTTTINGSRFFSSNSSDRLLLLASQNEDSKSSSSSFVLEQSASDPRSAEFLTYQPQTPVCVSEMYHDRFYDSFHINYCGEFDHESSFIASLRYISLKTAIEDIYETRAIVRTQYRNCHVSDIINGTNDHNILQILFNKMKLPAIRTCIAIGDPKANEKIYSFDKINDERYNCKIGVIYQRLNQTDEYDIFSNDYSSNEMWNFLEVLADRVPLKGFQKYRGDLDIKEDLHGEYSYYKVFESHEIMFNIAPLIPSTKANGQCIERKGLIGNAFVCIVFQEAGAIFSPDFISGKVTQIYITVQPLIHDRQIYYKIGIWRRNDITSVIDTPGGIFKDDEYFASYFLTLLLNSVNSAIESPSLRSRVYEQRQRLRSEELKKLCESFSQSLTSSLTPDIDHTHSQLDMRSGSRSESISSNATVTTSDSASTNTGRISPGTVKKKGFSKKLFGVFSSRSASLSSASSQQTNNDGLPGTPTAPVLPDALISLARANMLSNKEATKPTRSMKSSQAPGIPRLSNSQMPQSISIQPPTPSLIPSNPLISESLTQNNLLNTAALNITPRNRSNSSPDDSVNTNKSQPFSVSTINEEADTTSTSDDVDSEEESSEDDRPLARRPR